MENQNKNKVAWIVWIIIVLIGGGWFYFGRGKGEPGRGAAENGAPAAEEEEMITVHAKHQYKNGIHTYAGTFPLPTPCDTLRAEASPVRSSVSNGASVDKTDNKVVIALTIVKSDQICIQVITDKPWQVSFEAPQDVSVELTVKGKAAKLNVFEVGANENFEKFMVEPKG